LKIVAKTITGLEQVLAKEIESLGGINVETINRAVTYEGDLKVLYASNHLLRTALRVMIPIFECRIKDEQDLYDAIYQIPWEEVFHVKQTFATSATVSSTLFTHSQYVALKTKDAIADRFRAKFDDKRPYVNTLNPDIAINVHINYDRLTVSLDSSGQSLHKRDYRVQTLEAPINEVLAAGMILLSEWDLEQPLIDPMCGSGTIPIEACKIKYNIPPQSPNRRYAFQNWGAYDEALWHSVIEEADKKIKPKDTRINIFGYDKQLSAVRYAGINAKEAGVEDAIEFHRMDFFKFPKTSNALIIFNPPYDERIKVDDVYAFYKTIGDKLKTDFLDCQAWVISGNKEALLNLGLRPSKRVQLMNGALPAPYYKYEIYEGTRRKFEKTLAG